MALVPYRVSGAAADQRADVRLLQLPGGITLRLAQRPGVGVAGCSSRDAQTPPTPALRPAGASASGGTSAGAGGEDMDWKGPPLASLANVGLVVWQAGFLLADYLLRRPPFGDRWVDPAAAWRPLTVVDLGTGSGVVGIALALAGARVFLTDLPHVLPLAEANVAANCDPRVCRTTICAYRWGDAAAAPPQAEETQPHAERMQQQGQAPAATLSCSQGGVLGSQVAEAGQGRAKVQPVQQSPSPLSGVTPDLITAADVLYHPALLQPLMAAIERLSAPHTLTYVSYRVRHGGEVTAFALLAEAAGFAVEDVPDAHLHEEYRRGSGGMDADVVMRDGAGEGDDDGVEGSSVCDVALDASADVVRQGRPPGIYGILRLCRRDALVPPSGLS